jgi:hypothetical protein
MSWQLRCGFPEYLQLSGYIAIQEGFEFETHTGAQPLIETEWRMWWESLMLPPTPFAILPHQTDPWRRVTYDPPNFVHLAHWPDMQALCQRYFPEFHRHWGMAGGEQERLTGLMHEQLLRVRIDQIVDACVAVSGKRRSAPFTLMVDFVQWPTDFQRIASGEYLVLGKQYVEPGQALEFQEVLGSVIAGLV